MGRSRRKRQTQPREGGRLLDRVSPTSLLFLGLILGLAGALYYAWVVSPVEYVDASPARLSDRHKAEYLFLVSESYAAEGNWSRARRRLDALNDPAIDQTVINQLEDFLRQRRPADEIRNLAVLAQALGAEGAAVALFAPTPLSELEATDTPTPAALPTATATPTLAPTRTPLPTSTPTSIPSPSPTAQLVYRLLAQQRVCRADEDVPLIQVITQDALLNPLPGVEVLVSWETGDDHFFTGFKPDQGAGYGDFTMSPNVSYTILLADGSPEVGGLRIEPCSGGRAGGWQLTFQNLILRVTETPQP